MVNKLKPLDQTEDVHFEPLPRDDDSGLKSLEAATNKRFGDIERLTKTVLFVAAISLVGVVIAGISLILDQMRFNVSMYEAENSQTEDRLRYFEERVELLEKQNELLRHKQQPAPEPQSASEN